MNEQARVTIDESDGLIRLIIELPTPALPSYGAFVLTDAAGARELAEMLIKAAEKYERLAS